MDYTPRFEVTSEMIQFLGKIEAAREIIATLETPLLLERKLRKEASVKITHYSTKIEGNRLTLKQTRELLEGKKVVAREIDKREVRNYYDCLEFIYKTAQLRKPFREDFIKKLHAIIQRGIVQGKLRGEYREAQNAIFDARTGKAVYFPPEASDVGPLIRTFVTWLCQEKKIHPVLKAGISHYQMVSIHPFMDGNGRTARALATFLLYREGYDVKRFYSLEEYYAEDLRGYYHALHACQGNHYYDQPNPNITSWLAYFTKGVAIAFEDVKERVLESLQILPARSRGSQEINLLQKLGPRERKVLSFFRKHLQLRNKDVCALFQIQERTARDLLNKWREESLVERRGGGKRDAHYVLSADYRRLIGS